MKKLNKIMKNLKKEKCIIFIILAIIFVILSFMNTEVLALSQTYNYEYEKVENTVQDFIYYLEVGNSSIYNLVENENTGLYQGIVEYLYEDIDIEYEVTKIEKLDDYLYKIKGKIDASGENWNLNGFSVTFEVQKNYYGTYKIIYTDLFDKIGTENVSKIVLNMVGIIFLVCGLVFLITIGIIIMSVIIITVAVKKKNKNLVKK